MLKIEPAFTAGSIFNMHLLRCLLRRANLDLHEVALGAYALYADLRSRVWYYHATPWVEAVVIAIVIIKHRYRR